jgi:hypothetical protein
MAEAINGPPRAGGCCSHKLTQQLTMRQDLVLSQREIAQNNRGLDLARGEVNALWNDGSNLTAPKPERTTSERR